MRTQLLAATALAALAMSLPASAAPAPQITDPAGDSRDTSATTDIVSALFGTQGTTTKVGRKTVYTPTKLVVTVTYSGAPSADPQATHAVTFTEPGCGAIYIQVYSGGTWGFADCLGDADFGVSYKIAGNTVTYTLPFNTIGKQYFKPGTSLTDLAAYTSLSDPVFGFDVRDISGLDEGALDYATSAATFRI